MGRLRIFLLALLIGVVSAAPYGRSFKQGAVSIDDYTYVVEHEEVYGGVPAFDFKWIFRNSGHGIFMPLTWLSYIADCEIARHMTPPDAALDVCESVRFRVMHVHSSLLHGVNAALVFVFLLLLSKALPKPAPFAAAVCALFWGAHPLRVESVVWIASRKDLVSFFWLALALLSWGRWRLSAAGPSIRLSRPYWLANAFLVVGALAKPSVMVFPGLAFLVDYLVLRKVRLRKDGTWDFRGLLVYLVPVALGFAIAAEATAFQNVGGAMEDVKPFWYRCLNACVSYGVYLKNEAWPFDLAVECLMRYPRPPNFLVPGLALFGVCMVYFHRRFKTLKATDYAVAHADLPFAGMLWFCGALIPFVGIVGFGSHAFADRFTYIPSLGLSIAALGLLTHVRCRAWHLPTAAGAVLCLVPVSWRQVGFWDNEGTLWERTLAVDGDGNYIANVALGQYLFDEPHDVKAALSCFDRAYVANPGFVMNFGMTYMNLLSEAGEDERCFRFFKRYRSCDYLQTRTPESQPGTGMMTVNFAGARIAMLLTGTNFLDSAEKEIAELLEYEPTNQQALYMKGRLAEIRGDHAGALAAWRKAVETTRPSARYVRYRFLRNRIAAHMQKGPECR